MQADEPMTANEQPLRPRPAGHAPSRHRALEPDGAVSLRARGAARRGRARARRQLCRQYRAPHRALAARQIHRRRARHQGHGRGGATSTSRSRRRGSTACTSACSPICRAASCSSRTSTPAPTRNTGCRCGWSPTAPGTACSRATCSSGRRPAELADFEPAFTILHAPDFRAIPELDGIRSETFIFVNFA